MCGARHNMTTVARIVNIVKMYKQTLSITIAANFQSLMTSSFSSAFFIRLVMNCNSFRIVRSSSCMPVRGNEADVSSTVAGLADSGVPYADLLM